MSKGKVIGRVLAGTLAVAAGAGATYYATDNYNQKEIMSVRSELVQSIEENETLSNKYSESQNKVSELESGLTQKETTITQLETENNQLQQELSNSITGQDGMIPYTSNEDLGVYKKAGDTKHLYFRDSDGTYNSLEMDLDTYFDYLTGYFKIDDTKCLIFPQGTGGLGIMVYDRNEHTLNYVEGTENYKCRVYLGNGKFFLSSYNNTYPGLHYLSASDLQLKTIREDGYRYDYGVWLYDEIYRVVSSSNETCFDINIVDKSCEEKIYFDDSFVDSYSYDNFTFMSTGSRTTLFNRATKESVVIANAQIKEVSEICGGKIMVYHHDGTLKMIDINELSVADVVLDADNSISDLHYMKPLNDTEFFISWSNGSTYYNGKYNVINSTYTDYSDAGFDNSCVIHMEKMEENKYLLIGGGRYHTYAVISIFDISTGSLTKIENKSLRYMTSGSDYKLFLNKYLVAVSYDSSYPGVTCINLETSEISKYGDFMIWKSIMTVDENTYIVLPSKSTETNFVITIEVLENTVDINLEFLV